MKKTISGVLLALAATCALVACGKKKTEKDETTTKKARKRSGKANIINFYCWNDEFQSRVNRFYGGEDTAKKLGKKVAKTNGSATVLTSGQTIQWTTASNEGSVYQDTLDIALDNNIVDMFCFEADYATKYVKSEYVLDLGSIGIDQSKQYKYTRDIVTNADGKLVGSSWQATPGVIIYNSKVAEAAFTGVTYDEMNTKLSSYANFKTAAEALKTAGKKALIGPACWYRTYANNLSAKMLSADGKTITIDKNLFQWAKDTEEFRAAGYIHGVDKEHGLWQGTWGSEMGKDNCLCVFACPWFVDFSFKGYYAGGHEADYWQEDGDGHKKGDQKDANMDSGWRVVKGYSSWFWGGTWLAATQVSQQEATIKDAIKDIITNMTCTKSTLVEISKGTKDFTNDEGAMNELAADTTAVDPFFGGKNIYAIYVEAIKGADMSKSSDFDQQITEEFQSAFTNYFQETKNAEQAWSEFVTAIKDKTSVSEVKMASGVTLSGRTITC